MSKNIDLALPVEQADKDLQITIPVNSEISVDNSKAGLYRATTSGHKWVGVAHHIHSHTSCCCFSTFETTSEKIIESYY